MDENNNACFVLGSGFSRELSDGYLPTLQGLTQEFWQSTDTINGDLEDYQEFGQDNIELLLNYLVEDHPWIDKAEHLRHRALFLEVSQWIHDTIQEKEWTAFEELDDLPEWTKNLLTVWHQKKANVLTLNYDTCLERAFLHTLERGPLQDWHQSHSGQDVFLHPWSGYFPRLELEEVKPNYPSVPQYNLEDTFTLLKLHGSINWWYSGSNDFTGEPIYYTDWTNMLHPGFEGRYDDAKDMERDAQNRLVGKEPLIIPPTSYKNDFYVHDAIRAQWSYATEVIAKAKEIYILGYSMPVTDFNLRYLFTDSKRRANSKTDVFIVDYSEEAEEQTRDMKEHFERVLPTGYFSVRNDYLYSESPIPNFVEERFQGQLKGS